MRNTNLYPCLILFVFLLSTNWVNGQDSSFIYGDALPDAPELAMRGDFPVGVRTMEFVNKDQLDINNIQG